MTIDDEIRALERELAKDGVDRAWIEREINELRRLQGLATDAEVNGVETAISRFYRDAIRARLDRFPKLARLIAWLERRALGAEIGKVLELAGSTAGLVFVEVLFYAPDTGGSAYGEFELVDTIPVTKTTGDDVFCAVLCIYHGPTHIIINGSSGPYPASAETYDLVSVHEYDCGRPPSAEVLKRFCHRYLYRVIAN
jgi:hypothetical protein